MGKLCFGRKRSAVFAATKSPIQELADRFSRAHDAGYQADQLFN
jgi:hypothetical protein